MPNPLRELEVYRELLDMARGKTGRLPAEELARHVLAITEGGDFPVQREAMEALLRRLAFARRDGLRLASRPPGGVMTGVYRTSREGAASRPYTTLLRSVKQPAGSCDCADYLRSSLGLCKHLFTVLEEVAGRSRAAGGRLLPPDTATGSTAPRLVWDPVRPLHGHGDWLERTRWVEEGGRRAPTSLAAVAARRWFTEKGTLRGAFASQPGRRLELVLDLERFFRASARRSAGWPSDPALGPLLSQEHERLERQLSGDWVEGGLARHLRSLKQKLYPYQLEGVR